MSVQQHAHQQKEGGVLLGTAASAQQHAHPFIAGRVLLGAAR